eukprot:3568898-Alexandrium_andersonii.AAC.1
MAGASLPPPPSSLDSPMRVRLNAAVVAMCGLEGWGDRQGDFAAALVAARAAALARAHPLQPSEL